MVLRPQKWGRFSIYFTQKRAKMSKKTKKKAEQTLDVADLLGDTEIKEKAKTPEKPAQKPKKTAKKSVLGQEVTVKSGGAEFFGKVMAERGAPSGSQVFLKLNGLVSRWFNAEDVV